VAGCVVEGNMGTSNTQRIEWSITTGKDFSVGTNMKPSATDPTVNFNGLIGGTSTYNYFDKGAAQRIEPTCPVGGGGAGFLIH